MEPTRERKTKEAAESFAEATRAAYEDAERGSQAFHEGNVEFARLFFDSVQRQLEAQTQATRDLSGAFFEPLKAYSEAYCRSVQKAMGAFGPFHFAPSMSRQTQAHSKAAKDIYKAMTKTRAQARNELEALAEEQGVSPVADAGDLVGDFWPEDESVDEFVAAVREWRDDDAL